MRPSGLSGGSPRRLFHHAGKWVLEVVRHVNLGQDLIRPTTERLTGQRAIASYFKNNPDKALLAKSTQRLMQNELGDEVRSYSVEGGEWVANSMPPPRPDRPGSFRPPPDAVPLETEVGDLKAQVVVLTAVQEGLLTRLARLEAKLARGTFVADDAVAPGRAQLRPQARAELSEPESADGSPSGEDEAREASDADPPAPGGSARPERQQHEGARASKSPEGGEATPENAPAPDAPPASPDQPPTPTRILLALPPISDIGKCVSLLIGGDVTCKEAEPFAVNRTTKDCYAASILDDNDQTVGLILMDCKATVYLGGTLMMLPKTELEQQLKALTPGEDSIAASSEICNALSGAINGAQDQHVRVGRLEKFEFKAWSWVTEPADRRDLEDSFGGKTVVFSRPLPVQIF